ncbi:threonine/serine dehydratase [Candidatus Palauibacter soopunensis]|uniref:threonine/serine dehydratase n=1 Tax=Candidatus Palauibacter soopunensis TaxID=3056739 RepID=UPI00238AD2FA|nr:threonine/serine dehydratase [Candidatus Palauibacter soopunensis]MDE2879016.1 threonine/serine dehydratase [Candidatus Palauibacter soopunensis]
MTESPTPGRRPPTPAQSRKTRARVAPWIERTPVRRWIPDRGIASLPAGIELFLKLELFQRTGSYKVRGALNNVLCADAETLQRGVTAVSAGNHAVSVAYAARAADTTAKVVMLSSANPARVARCRNFGAEIEFADDGASGFARMEEIARQEGRLEIHPFEGEATVFGTSTVGLEVAEQLPDLDALVVPIGGGGLISGTASIVKQLAPVCSVYGVEPVGADSMRRSLDAGEPVALDRIDTIADSLGAPHAAPYTFGLVQRYVDDVVLVDDDAIRAALKALFLDAKLVAEPASAAPLAATCGPLRERLEGRRVGLVLSGSNIDLDTFGTHIRAAG